MSNNDSLGQIVMKLIFYDFKVAALMATFYDSRDPWAQTESIGADPKLGSTQFWVRLKRTAGLIPQSNDKAFMILDNLETEIKSISEKVQLSYPSAFRRKNPIIRFWSSLKKFDILDGISRTYCARVAKVSMVPPTQMPNLHNSPKAKCPNLSY